MVRVWGASTGKVLLALSGHSGPVLRCGFSSDGERVVSSGYDGTVRLWDALSGECLEELRGHSGGVWSCGFSRDGSRVVSSGLDGTVRLWDASTGQEHGVRMHHLPGGEHATLRTDGSGAVQVSRGAWRWLGWLVPDPRTGALERYPAEIFGPLPVWPPMDDEPGIL